MKYAFTFNEVNYGRIEIESNHNPDKSEIIEKILEGMADYKDTDFTDFRLVEADGVTKTNDSYMCCLHETPRTFEWCEENCERYYSCDTVAWAGDELNEDKADDTGSPGSFNVTITETLRKVVTVEADSKIEAEQLVSENWRNSEYILDSDSFMGVEFNVAPVAA